MAEHAKWPKPEALEAEIGRGSVAPAYLLLGPGEFLIDRLVRKLAGVREARLVLVDGGETSAHQVRVEVLVGDLFATPKVVHVRDATAWKPKERKELFAEAAAGGLPAGMTLVLSGPAKSEPKEAIPEAGRAAFFWNPFPSALPGLAEGLVRDHGGLPRPGVGALLVERFGTDLRRIDQEARKLALASEGRPVDPGMVEALCGRLPESRGFLLAAAVTARDRDRALALLGALLETESPHGLVAMVANRLRRMAMLKELGRLEPERMERARKAAAFLGEDPMGKPISRAAKVPHEKALGDLVASLPEGRLAALADQAPWQLSGLVLHQERFNEEELGSALGAVAIADRDLKGGGGDEAFAVERMILAIAPAGKPGRSAPRARSR